MSTTRLGVAGYSFQTEASYAQVMLTVSGTPTPSSGILTVTTTGAHGLTTASVVTFSGSSATGYNGTAFQVLTVPSSTTFTISTGTLLGQLTGATIYVQPVFYLASGEWCITTGANALVEYNPDNTGTIQNVNPTSGAVVTGATWRSLVAASGVGAVSSDGFGVRLRISTASAGTTYASQFK